MTKEPKEPTQHTEKGAEIPIPSREQVLGDLEKVARPRKQRKNGHPEQR